MKAVYLFTLFSFALFSCQAEKKTSKYPDTVGDIAFDDRLDEAGFKKCGAGKDRPFSFQYYHGPKMFDYKGEKIAVKEKLKKENIYSEKKVNGYITVRFLVNCEGKTGLFRLKHMDSDLKDVVLDEELENKLLEFTKSLNGWMPKEIEGLKVDYYQYLTYKIEDGKVSEVLP
ncbi:uncharacterized protein CHSO_4809 [Chryseobacterium sp. StRB126]|uniref:hypothetical protein n=1 Tax=Chryseobacterium sp. StRB126 TaxID=878220 RepID=UPI0004E99662|nr:hypothetical protein [Chryseobacterium sp. StRB126]BAP33846.1 uncharacterized protein CHSO_4809 [Chryseobacterium sp. StRB126]